MSRIKSIIQWATNPGRHPLRLLYGGAVAIVLLLASADVFVVFKLRESALRGAGNNLGTVSLTLSEQCERTFQSLDLVLNSVAEVLTAEGVDDPDVFSRKMANRSAYVMLRDKLTGLPFIDALSMVGADGKIINFSRFWPTPDINVADRDYFQALSAKSDLTSFISAPVQNRGTGTWTLYLARRVQAKDGRFIGLVLGAVELRYFEDLYRAVSLGPGSAITLFRDDGTMLARYPDRNVIGQRIDNGGWRAVQEGVAGVLRGPGVSDQQMRVKVARHLAGYPLVVLATKTEDMILRDWRKMVWLVSLITGGCALSVFAAVVTLGQWLRQQEALARERAERSEVEQGRAYAEANLARAREKAAEDANQAKSGFLAMMSHEIRTPMNAVLGLASALLDGSLSPQHRRIVESIHESGEGLLRLLNDILDFSKLDAGRMTFESIAFSPIAVTESVVGVFEPRAAAKGLTIRTDIAADIPPGLDGDPGRVRQVLMNLVSNATKFTQRGGVCIGLRCVTRDELAATVEWSIRDSGLGIDAERLPGLFREFVQMDDSIARRFGGSGLGLAICKRLLDQMGGQISVSSTPGEGSEFRVRLTFPVCAVAPPPPLPADVVTAFEAAVTALGRPMRVLLVEDNPTNQFVGLELLRDFNLRIDLASDGIEALAAVSRVSYDAIFMDMRMPEMDGLTATRLIRARGGPHGAVPIIALTANAFADDMKSCQDAGMNAFLTKPIKREAMVGALLAVLTGRQVPALAPADTLPPGNRALDQESQRYLREIMGNDRLHELYRMFEDETRQRLENMHGFINDIETVMAELHTLKGAAGSVGAVWLTDAVATLEDRIRQGKPVNVADLSVLERAFQAWLSEIPARAV